jgi:hypothetical protein
MNERILNLARQVWPDPNISHTNHMKFAELIVQQCILAVEFKTSTTHICTTYDEGLVLHTIKNSANAIKDHFDMKVDNG